MSDENYNDGEAESAQETIDALNNNTDMSFVAPEEKKPVNRTSMVLFLIVALGGGGLYLMHLKAGPKSASASNEAANQTINQFLHGGQSNIKLMETMLRSTEKVVQQFNSYPSVKQIPLNELQTNPFRASSASNDEDDPIAKRKLAEQRQAVIKAYQTLQLQSIMYGETNRSCLINNTLYREGQQVNGFVIEKIATDGVSVKQGVWRFDLMMQK
ncbi:MAG TPA: hypothetical protein VHS31_09640 [Tepidisphaeraceae bacterium]|nr:hypothetical protein [Tepidisphaeraceae bacterium]